MEIINAINENVDKLVELQYYKYNMNFVANCLGAGLCTGAMLTFGIVIARAMRDA